jgi:hypothetical protein
MLNVRPTPQCSGISTSSSMSAVVACLNSGGYNGAAFQAWAAPAQGKATPYALAGAWLAGEAISGALSTAAGAAGAATTQAAEGAVKGAESLYAQPNTCCLLKFPGIAGVGSFCILSKSEARALVSGLLLVGAAVVTLVGLASLFVVGFEKSGAGSAAGGVLETAGAGLAVVPGAEGAGLALGAAGAGARRAGSSSGSRQSLERRRSARSGAQREAAAGQRPQPLPNSRTPAVPRRNERASTGVIEGTLPS